jgi:hypothetical protein
MQVGNGRRQETPCRFSFGNTAHQKQAGDEAREIDTPKEGRACCERFGEKIGSCTIQTFANPFHVALA